MKAAVSATGLSASSKWERDLQGVYLRERNVDRFEYADTMEPLMRTGDSWAGGSNKTRLVELAGLAPATPSVNKGTRSVAQIRAS